jgi:hypothetical protein
MADQGSRKPTWLVRLSLCTLIACSPAQAADYIEGCTASPDTGQPVWFQRGPLIWGLSTRPASPGQDLRVVLWIHNPSNAPLSVMSCGDIYHFWTRETQILDSTGNRVLTRSEQKRLEAEKENPGSTLPAPFRCWLNYDISIPARSCLHGSFSSTPPSDFIWDLNGSYVLPPGRYSLVPFNEKEPEQSAGSIMRQWVRLPITVLDH